MLTIALPTCLSLILASDAVNQTLAQLLDLLSVFDSAGVSLFGVSPKELQVICASSQMSRCPVTRNTTATLITLRRLRSLNKDTGRNLGYRSLNEKRIEGKIFEPQHFLRRQQHVLVGQFLALGRVSRPCFCDHGGKLGFAAQVVEMRESL